VKTANGVAIKDREKIKSRREALDHLLRSLWSGDAQAIAQPSEISIVGHRIVHGGPEFEQPVLITQEVKRVIAKVAGFAPLHNQAELAGIDLVEELLGTVPQVAVFDTSFHRNLPRPAAVYPGPYEWFERGIRRYGFHGISHQYCSERAAEMLGKELAFLRLITCHLGNGCSLAAIDRGRSVDTTMGFTPLEGLMMGTRSGSVDPGILTYLIREDRNSGEQIDNLLNEQSGLLGISGVSGDMRLVLNAMKARNKRAELAFAIFIHRLRSCMGSMLMALNGVDAVVFTAGIGENSPEVREAACAAFGFLGLKVDPGENRSSQGDRDIATPDSSVRVLVVRAQEEWAIARECWRIHSSSKHMLP
jgi:acetate kinase